MRVRLYTREGCHLCEDARDVVERVCRTHEAPWEDVDIARSADLTAEYGEMIPVVEVDGRVIGYWRVDERRLVEALRSGG